MHSHGHHDHHEHSPGELHNHAPKAKGLRRAKLFSLLTAGILTPVAFLSGNAPLALEVGHQLGDSWALDDEAKASETDDKHLSAKHLRRAARKVLGFSLLMGTGEVVTETVFHISHRDIIGLGGNVLSLTANILARRSVHGDSHHSDNGIGHAHTDRDVKGSILGTIGTAVGAASGAHWLLYPTAAAVMYQNTRAFLEMQELANDFDKSATEPLPGTHNQSQ